MTAEKGIAIACFTGAALGALLALQLGYFWWIGILAGGAIGYVCFRFEEALEALRRAWKSLPEAKAATAAIRTGLWNFVRLTGAVIAMLCFGVSTLIMIVGAAMSLVLGEEMSMIGEAPVTAAEEMGIPGQYWAVGAAGLVITAAVLVLCVWLATRNWNTAWRAVLSCFLLTPPVLPFTMAFAVGSALLPPTGRALVRLGVLGVKAARQTFLLIHSELRLLCLTDAMIGAGVGYFCGNALIGGLAGAVFGLGNYRLVSVRLLKLVKARS